MSKRTTKVMKKAFNDVKGNSRIVASLLANISNNPIPAASLKRLVPNINTAR